MQFQFKTSLISKLKSIYNVPFPERLLKGIRQHTISVNTYCLLNKLSLKSSVKMTWQIIHNYALNPLIYLTKVTTISHAHTSKQSFIVLPSSDDPVECTSLVRALHSRALPLVDHSLDSLNFPSKPYSYRLSQSLAESTLMTDLRTKDSLIHN